MTSEKQRRKLTAKQTAILLRSESAFPALDGSSEGLSVRDYFAAAALNGYASNDRMMNKALDDWDQNGGRRPICVADFFAGLAYEVADAMLRARETK